MNSEECDKECRHQWYPHYGWWICVLCSEQQPFLQFGQKKFESPTDNPRDYINKMPSGDKNNEQT